MAYGLDRVNAEKDIRVLLLEAADRILQALPEHISEATLRFLANLGIEVHPGAKVSEICGPTASAWQAVSSSPSELVVWSTGVPARLSFDVPQAAGGQSR